LGEWFFVEGLVERGEAPSKAALRELAEETGLVPAEFYVEEREPRVVPASTSRVVMHVFVAFVPGRARVRLNAEHSAYPWVRLVEAETTLPLPAQRRALTRVRERFLAGDRPRSLRLL
jgi:dATP pyrophosphohydrolase